MKANERKSLAVVGAGPKAAALAAWVTAWERARAGSAIKNLGEEVAQAPRIIVFEEDKQAAASWIGGRGYSDGTPELCTPDKPDVTIGAGAQLPVSVASQSIVATELLRELGSFSWQDLMPAHPALHPPHQTFGSYVAKVLTQASGDVEVHYAEKVTGIRPTSAGRWTISTSRREQEVDGVVVTGPGPVRFKIPGAGAIAVRRRYRNAHDYWSPARADRAKQISDWLLTAVEDGSSPHVVIVGAGGAAVGIAADLCERFDEALCARSASPEDDGVNLRITFVAPQAGLFTRGESRWETRTLSDAELWKRLSRELRARVNDHLVSGVTFRRVLDQLESWTDPVKSAPVAIEVEPGKLVWVDDGADSDSGLPQFDAPLRVVVSRVNGELVAHGAHLLVGATGFDAQWFIRDDGGIVKPRALAAVLAGVDLPNTLDEHLAVDLRITPGDDTATGAIVPLRRLHLPMLAGGTQPPGLGSLINLGRLAERILRPYMIPDSD